MTKPVDVVAVLRRAVDDASRSRWGNRTGEDSLNLMLRDERDNRAVDAVAELIAADVEYDSAEDALNKRGCFEDEGPMILRMKLADERRAAALAACKPPSKD